MGAAEEDDLGPTFLPHLNKLCGQINSLASLGLHFLTCKVRIAPHPPTAASRERVNRWGPARCPQSLGTSHPLPDALSDLTRRGKTAPAPPTSVYPAAGLRNEPSAGAWGIHLSPPHCDLPGSSGSWGPGPVASSVPHLAHLSTTHWPVPTLRVVELGWHRCLTGAEVGHLRTPGRQVPSLGQVCTFVK